ncbi:hypothetical protein HMPREF1246_0776 [Acidaminococcus sp. BV3L6]|nr:hypothetical protein HMPREF1246_0776 [Acidaminococcus sp. BV3L6]
MPANLFQSLFLPSLFEKLSSIFSLLRGVSASYWPFSRKNNLS